MRNKVVCPILKVDKGKRCKEHNCPFWSSKESTGCWHGQEISIRTIAHNKGIRQIDLKEYLHKAERKMKKWIAIYQYAIWCGDATTVTEADIKAWKKRRTKKPFSLPIFGFMTVERFARMRQLTTLEDWMETSNLDPSIKIRKFLEI